MANPVVFLEEDLISYIHNPALIRDGVSPEICMGGSGVVHIAEIPEDNPYGLEHQIVAVKVSLPNNAIARSQVVAEIELLPDLQHQNIIRMIGSCQAQDAYIVYEYAAGRDLKRKMAKLEWADALRIMRGIASAIEYLHGQGIRHGDLKPQNILLCEDLEPKVGDFGGARRVPIPIADHDDLPYTPGYKDPRSSPLGRTLSDDRFSLGMIMLGILTLQPAGLETVMDYSQKVQNGDDGVVRPMLRATLLR